jgi:hypothetical protein
MIEEHGRRREVKSYSLKVKLGTGEKVKGGLSLAELFFQMDKKQFSRQFWHDSDKTTDEGVTP